MATVQHINDLDAIASFLEEEGNRSLAMAAKLRAFIEKSCEEPMTLERRKPSEMLAGLVP